MTDTLKLPEGRSTRLFGANIFFDRPGAVLDVHHPTNQDELIKLCIDEIYRVLPAIGWEHDYQYGFEKYSRGFRIALSAPFDLLWAATDLLEYIWLSAKHKSEIGSYLSLNNAKEYMEPILEKQINLVYRQVYAEAFKRRLNIFESEDKVVIGSGQHAYIVDKDKLSLNNIPWDKIGEVKSVMVTGTNGKTTTVRLTSFICKLAGKNVGYCSTDWIMVNDNIMEKGDLSGPTGSHGVMVHPEVEIAVLEVARGALLRRGIATNFVKAATVTNVSEDHMGEDGVDTLEQLAQAKVLVYKSVAPDGYCVINLDDELIRKHSAQLTGKKIYITRDINNPEYAKFISSAQYICYTDGYAFYWRDKESTHLISEFAHASVTVNGHALHNIENAMHAIALSFALGITIEEIGYGLRKYENTAQNNQGRANTFEYNGAKIIVDFAHNVAAVNAMISLAKSYLTNFGRFAISFGNTGDRMYLADKITDLIVTSNPDFIIIKETSSYLRGTEPGQLVQHTQNMLIGKGIDLHKITLVDNELEALDVVLAYVQPGDVFLFLAHEAAGEVIDKLRSVV